MSANVPPAESFRVVLNCVTGEKIIFRRQLQGEALVEMEIERKIIKVAPDALWLAVKSLNLDPQAAGGK